MAISQVEDRIERKLLTGRGRGPGHLPASHRPRLSRCPVPGCSEQIDPSRLMCRRDWYLVPKSVRDQVWCTWRSGLGVHSREHREAVCSAILASHMRRQRDHV
jgi:hypothetical protein